MPISKLPANSRRFMRYSVAQRRLRKAIFGVIASGGVLSRSLLADVFRKE